MIERTKGFVQKIIRFLTYDIWRITKTDTSALHIGVYDIIKSFILAFRNINGSQLNTRASALTYSTLLSIIPLLAVLFAIARGFGFQNIVKSQLFVYFSGQEQVLHRAMSFIDSSLEYAQGGVFLGVGIVLLLYTVINLLSSIEANFNKIWQIKKGRTYYRLFTDYLALIVITPIFLICNAGLTILLNTTAELEIVGTVLAPIISVVPYVVMILLFTFLYMYIPNTKVNFLSALLAGIFTGVCFLLFQNLYISGQIWISKYNAIYGSFAALPLLLLWLQISWFICLFGVELSHANQNVTKFDFEAETNLISYRYKNFVMLLLMTLIVKRFEKGEDPYTANELSERYKIPTTLTNQTLFLLQDIGLIVETPSKEDLVSAYLPAIDINQITVAYLFNKVNIYGSEDFRIDISEEFVNEWEAILDIGRAIDKDERLLKDL